MTTSSIYTALNTPQSYFIATVIFAIYNNTMRKAVQVLIFPLLCIEKLRSRKLCDLWKLLMQHRKSTMSLLVNTYNHNDCENVRSSVKTSDLALNLYPKGEGPQTVLHFTHLYTNCFHYKISSW